MRNALAYWERTRAPLLAKLISRYHPATGGIALDVGCGSGAVTRKLADRFECVIGLDIDQDAIYPIDGSVCMLLADAMRLPIRSGNVNFVFSYGALHHTRLSQALTEIARVVAPGGMALLIDFCASETRSRDAGLRYLRYLRTVLCAFGGYRRRLGYIPAMRISVFRLGLSWRRHLRDDHFLAADDFIEAYSAMLPGAQFHPDEGRMVVVWKQPNAE